MDPLQFLFLLILLGASLLLQWLSFVLALHANRRDFNKFAMDLDRFMDGDDKVRTKLLNLENKLGK